MSLLQERKYTVGERLILLGIFYEKVENLVSQGKNHDIPSMITIFQQLIEDEKLKEELLNIPSADYMQISLLKTITDIKVTRGTNSHRYLELYKEAMLGIGYKEKENRESVLENYEKAYKNYYTPFMKKNEHIIENFLVNEFFKEMMPFGAYKTISDSYTILAILYGMVKLHLIGLAGYHKGLNKDLVVKLIQSLSKATTHNRRYLNEIIRLFKKYGYDTLEHISILVKD